MLSSFPGLDEQGPESISVSFMSASMSSRPSRLGSGTPAFVFALAISLGAPLAACGDDDPSGNGGGGSVTSSDAATGSTASTSAAIGSTSGSTSGSGGDTGVGGEGGSGTGGTGEGGTGSGGDDGEGGSGGAGEGGGGGSPPVCPEQPLPYALDEATEDPCLIIEADEEAPLFHVQFFPEIKEVDYDGIGARDYAARYVLWLPIEDIEEYALFETRCQQLAGEDVPTCSESQLDISSVASSCSVRYGARFGLDPENVNEGINEFEFNLTLFKGCARVDTGFIVTVNYEPAE